MGTPLRIDPEQRFACSQCGRCCYRWDVTVTEAEMAFYRRRNAGDWFRERAHATEGSAYDPFEPIPGFPGMHRIRKRADGGCGFLSPDNRCRIHEELGADRKPLVCRMYPFSLYPAADATVVAASFGCPSIVANHGTPIGIGEARESLESLRAEWFAAGPPAVPARQLVEGRAIESRSVRILRDSLLAMLKSDSADIRITIRRIAASLEDLTRHRVVSLPDDAFAEYVALKLPHAASTADAPPSRRPTRIGRLLQYGFLYAVAATRLGVEHRQYSPARLRLARLLLLAHFHRLAPAVDRVNVAALRTATVDINAPAIRPIVFHYLRSHLESLGGRDRPIVDDLAIAVSFLNAACALAVMNASAAGRAIDAAGFSEALIEAVHLSHTDDRGVMAGLLRKLTGGTEALRKLDIG